MDQGLTMRDKLIGRPCWTTPDICVSKLNKCDIGIATAQNRLSSVNRTMTALRGDQYVSVSTMPDRKRC